MQTLESVASKSINEKIDEFLMSMHSTGEWTKEIYASKLKQFVNFLVSKGISSFEDADRRNIDLFLSKMNNANTKNLSITTLRLFYKHLGLPEKIKYLSLCKIHIEPITPSEILTPEEVMKLANEAGKRRELYKVLTLTLYESCARISEVTNLRLGDVIFGSVVDKEGKRRLIATLHFKRSKGGVKKQPVVLVMFASELKRWCDNHPFKGDEQSWLFPSPFYPNQPVSQNGFHAVLQEAGERLGLKKRTNPHWLRHSGLSYFANNKNYNEQLLMWRAGWTNTAMARRYIHSGAELEAKAYLERMGFQIEEKEEKKILPKTCPHCQAINPYTNTNCDFCAMPLDLEEYKREIEKKRKITELYDNLEGLSKGKLTEEQEAMIKAKRETIAKLIEFGRDDLAEQYIEKLLESWVKTFLTV
jgi:site-specific recombinase XerD